MPSLSMRHAEHEALDAVDVVDADRRDQHADEQADQRVGERAAAERDDARESEEDDGEIFGRVENDSATFANGMRERHHHGRRDEPADQPPRQRPAERPRGVALRWPSSSRPTAAARPSARRERGTGSTSIAPAYVPETYIAVSRMIDGRDRACRYVNGSASTTPMTSVSPGSTATSMPSDEADDEHEQVGGLEHMERNPSRDAAGFPSRP